MLRLELCNLKKISRKNNIDGYLYIAQVLCICEGKTCIVDYFVDEKIFNSLVEIYNKNLEDDKITIIPTGCLRFDIYNNGLICKVDFSAFI